MDYQRIDRWLDDHAAEMEADLMELIRIPSVKEPPLDGMPFGRPVAEALNHILSLCAQMGMETENQENYAGTADIPGTGNGQVGVLAHVDVVPAEPSKWLSPPFQAEIRDGFLYGRGAEDDKGPAIASIYAGKALMECGFSMKKTVRYIFGGDEESGCSCMKYYTEHNSPPDCGFTPDGSFPAIAGEKGGAKYSFCKHWDTASAAPLQLVSADAGTAINIVPERASALFRLEDGTTLSFPQAEGIEICQTGREIQITALGKAAHSSAPWEGCNAILRLFSYLNGLPFGPAGAKDYIEALAGLFQDPYYGNGLGVAEQDEYSRLTCVPSLLELRDGRGALTCDMRTPVTCPPAKYRQTLDAVAQRLGMTLEGWDDYPALYVSQEEEFFQSLLSSYREFTGDMSEPLIIGGGTYAKHFDHFVAFGPQFPGQPEQAHQANECISCADLLRIAKIYARAIYRLAQ